MIRFFYFSMIFLMAMFSIGGCAQPTKIKINFEANGGTSVASIKADSNYSHEFPANPEKPGFVFAGWYLDDGVFVDYLDLGFLFAEENPPAEITVYARWEIKDALVTFFLGHRANFATTESGKFVAWGNNSSGMFGDGTSVSQPYFHDVSDILVLDASDALKTIISGYSHTVALTQTGRIFAWGSNFYGQIGDGSGDSSLDPVEITGFFALDVAESIVSIYSGINSTFAITSADRVFFWGDNNSSIRNNLFTEDSQNWWLPYQVTTPKDISYGMTAGFNANETIAKIVCSYETAAMITTSGRLFVWGSDELGFFKPAFIEEDVVSFPVDQTPKFMLAAGETIVDVAVHGFGVMALTSQNRLFAYGYNMDGALATGAIDVFLTPVDITTVFNLQPSETIITIGLTDGCNAVVLTSNGRLFSWGYNESGRVGDGTFEDRLFPVDITSMFALDASETIEQIYFGTSGTGHVFTNNGRLFVFGANSLRYGDGTLETKAYPTKIYE